MEPLQINAYDFQPPKVIQKDNKILCLMASKPPKVSVGLGWTHSPTLVTIWIIQESDQLCLSTTKQFKILCKEEILFIFFLFLWALCHSVTYDPIGILKSYTQNTAFILLLNFLCGFLQSIFQFSTNHYELRIIIIS